MAKARTTGTTLKQLQAENERLRTENQRLQGQKPAPKPRRRSSWRALRTVGAVVFTILAVLLLVAGNLLFWTGSTIVNNDRFNASTAPIIRNATVQKAVANYTTTQLYNNYDVSGYVETALPPRADFLVPTITGQLRGYTQTALQKILARQQFQDRWNRALARAHAGFINTVKQSGGDGTINLNDLYQQLSASLKGTRLSFLADKQLPAKVGNVQVVSGSGIKTLHQVAAHINTWRVLAIVLFLVCAGLAIYLSRQRRKAVARLGLFLAVALFVTLIALRITREAIADKAIPAYADAVRQTAQIVFHPLVVQTTLLLVLFLLVALVAWLTGASRSARYVRDRVQLLLAGKLHHAIFGERENAFTRWVGKYKRVLQWGVVIVVALLMLITRLTPVALLWYVVAAVVLVLVIEFLGAPVQRPARRPAANTSARR